MAKNVKIVFKTVAELTGLTRLHRAVLNNVPGIGKLETGFKKAGEAAVAMGRIGTKAIKGLTVTLLGFTATMAASVKQAVAFNTGVARAWTMMSTAGIKDIKRIRGELIDMGADFGVARDQLSAGLYDSLSKGVSEENVMEFLSVAAKASVADGEATVKEAVNALLGVINTYKKDVTEAGDVSDILFATLKNGSTDLNQLSASLANAAPLAAAMGVGLDEVLGAYAAMTQQSIPTSTAMIIIGNSMGKVSQQLGDGWAKSMSFQEALEEIAKTANYSETALGKIFGQENLKGIMALTGANFTGSLKAVESLQDRVAQTAEMAAKQDFFKGPWAKLKEEISATFLTLGISIEENLRPTIEYLRTALSEFRKGDTFKEFSKGLAEGVGNAIKNLIAGVATAAEMAKVLFTSGPAAIGATLKVLVEELVNLAVSTLIEFLRAHWSFFKLIGSVIGGAFIETVLKLPGMGKFRKNAAVEGLQDLSYQDAEDMGLLAGNQAAQMEGRGSSVMMPEDMSQKISRDTAEVLVKEMEARGMSELTAKAGGITSPDRVQKALDTGRGDFADARQRLGDQYDQSMARVQGTYQTGFGFSPSEYYQGQLAKMDSLIPAVGAAGAGSMATPAAAPPTRQDLMSTLNTRLGMEQKDVTNAGAMGASAGYTQQQQAQVKQVETVLSELANGNQELFDTLISRLQEVSKKQKDQAARARSLPL